GSGHREHGDAGSSGNTDGVAPPRCDACHEKSSLGGPLPPRFRAPLLEGGKRQGKTSVNFYQERSQRPIYPAAATGCGSGWVERCHTSCELTLIRLASPRPPARSSSSSTAVSPISSAGSRMVVSGGFMNCATEMSLKLATATSSGIESPCSWIAR